MTTDVFHISDTSFPSLLAPRDPLTLGIDSGVSYVPHGQFISPELVGDDGKGDYFRPSALLLPLSIDRVGLIGQVHAHDWHVSSSTYSWFSFLQNMTCMISPSLWWLHSQFFPIY